MKTKEFENLKEGDKVTHKHYGVCAVTGYIPDFGPTLHPETAEGLVKLKRHSETVEMFRSYSIDTPFLEHKPRCIINKLP
jgi:hypothetical protein